MLSEIETQTDNMLGKLRMGEKFKVTFLRDADLMFQTPTQ